MSVDSLGLSLDGHDTITFWASRTDETASLAFRTGGTYCEIVMARENVEALRDQLPEVLAGLDRWAAEEGACGQACRAEQRAMNAAGQALDIAAAAEVAGADELAASLRAAVAETTEKGNAVDATLRAVGKATGEVDYAAAKLVSLTGDVQAVLGRLPGGARPVEVTSAAGASV